MYGDISRFSHAPRKHFSRVVYQQGRVFLDADPNEQTEILLRLQRDFIRDLVGAHGGPAENLGFAIEKTMNGDDLEIGPGRYYVDGILCDATHPETAKIWTYRTQPNHWKDSKELSIPEADYLVYLDVWERHVSSLEDAAVRDAALGEADTATRTQVVWQVRVGSGAAFTGNQAPTGEDIRKAVELRTLEERGKLRARARPGESEKSPCIAAPTALYRGPENQLYRVEISRAGDDGDAWYRWSRDNGSVVFAIRAIAKGRVRLWSLGRDHTRTLKPGDLVELVNDDTVLRGEALPLARVEAVDRDETTVTLDKLPEGFSADPSKHRLLRRWDGEGKVETRGADAGAEPRWLPLEDGVEVEFMPDRVWRAGDYWLIPARTATGQVEWPGGPEDPAEEFPLGVEHHYAPLALVDGGAVTKLRTKFELETQDTQ